MKLSLKILSIFLACSLLFINCNSLRKVENSESKFPINIILLIGDGMGLAQICAASVINGGLTLDIFNDIGFLKTASADDYITDSAAGATAFSTGEKTYNGAVGVGVDTLPLKTIVELAEEKNIATGLIATSSVTHATPASFYAHQKNREMHLQIANDFYDKGIDFLAGTGKPYFNIEKLLSNQYSILNGHESVTLDPQKKYIWFYNDSIHPPVAQLRSNWLAHVTNKAIQYFDQKKNGFFLMIEGSQIDWGGHNNDLNYTVSELIDFDKAVKIAYDYAQSNKNTLVIVTADHETGGLSLIEGSEKNKEIKPHYSTGHHTGIMVPVYAFGPGSHLFRGTMENTQVYKNIKYLLKL